MTSSRAGEYVKLDPKTLGVGSYQHDLDAKQVAGRPWTGPSRMLYQV